MIRRIVDWLEHRTGLESAVKHFLYENVPASAGWHQVFGSVAAFCFLLQAFTGILLAFNYAPTPPEAYDSVKYIITELTGGRMMRGLHHWGASMMIVVVVLHMVQVFLWGAYKKPREATWMVGVVLLLFTFVYGLTGYLLPWDNRAYWGTVVATQIAASAPIAGPYLTTLLGGSSGIGVITFARFYAIHVLLLPPATLILIAIHIYLVRKHGVAPIPSDAERPTKKFYPGQVFKDTVAIFVAFILLFTLAVVARVPLERLADPTDTTYIPRPDWYFLFLFEMLKFFEGPLEIVGSVILPGLAVLALILVPFVDRGVVKRVTQRTFAAGVVLLAALTWTGLTVAAMRSTPASPTIDVTAETTEAWQELSPVQLSAIGLMRRESCAQCHNGNTAPAFTSAKTHDLKWIAEHVKKPGSTATRLSGGQANSMAAFLLAVNAEKAQTIDSAPAFAVEGAMTYQQFGCAACHRVNETGSKGGVALNGLAERRSREWIEQHFLDPQKMSPGTSMPPYKFSSKEMDRITSYLLSMR